MKPRFRFENVEIWRLAKQLAVEEVDELLEDCDKLSRKITAFSRSLK